VGLRKKKEVDFFCGGERENEADGWVYRRENARI